MRNFKSSLGILLNQQYIYTGPVNFLNNFKYALHNQWCQSQRWFIHHKQFWLTHQGSADCKHLLLSSGKCSCQLPFSFLHSWEQIKNPILIFKNFSFIFSCIGSKHKVFINRQVWDCLLYTSPSPRDGLLSRMPSSA